MAQIREGNKYSSPLPPLQLLPNGGSSIVITEEKKNKGQKKKEYCLSFKFPNQQSSGCITGYI